MSSKLNVIVIDENGQPGLMPYQAQQTEPTPNPEPDPEPQPEPDPMPEPSPSPSPTGDDWSKLMKAFEDVFQHGKSVELEMNKEYVIDKPVKIHCTGDNARAAALFGRFARIRARNFSSLDNAIEVSCEDNNRFKIVRDLNIVGDAHRIDADKYVDRASVASGLALKCMSHTSGWNFYNLVVDNVNVENCDNGIEMTGNVFESRIINSCLRDNAANGILLQSGSKDGKMGVLSAIELYGVICGQNGGNGLYLGNDCRDVTVIGGYYPHNKGFGIRSGNGIRSVIGSGFEGNLAGAGINVDNYGDFEGCFAIKSGSTQEYLIISYVIGSVMLSGCRSEGGGKLALIKNKHDNVTVSGCSGEVVRS